MAVCILGYTGFEEGASWMKSKRLWEWGQRASGISQLTAMAEMREGWGRGRHGPTERC